MTSLTAAATIEHGNFGGHETFPLRYTWLPKGVRAVSADAQVFARDDAMVELGVGKNMVRSIRHWALACGVLEEDDKVANNRGRALRVSAVGRSLFAESGWDPYLEDPATLWALHFELASAPDGPTSWYWGFNHLPQPEFTRDELCGWLLRLAQERGWARVSPASVKRDVEVFLRTYVPSRASRTVALEDTLDSPLVELGLLRELGHRGSFLLQRGDHPSLPIGVFAYGLSRYLVRRGLSTKSIPVSSIAFAPGAPGRVFALSEDALMARLEQLEAATDGAIVFHDTAGLRQLLVHRQPDPVAVLGRHYRSRGRVRAA